MTRRAPLVPDAPTKSRSKKLKKPVRNPRTPSELRDAVAWIRRRLERYPAPFATREKEDMARLTERLEQHTKALGESPAKVRQAVAWARALPQKKLDEVHQRGLELAMRDQPERFGLVPAHVLKERDEAFAELRATGFAAVEDGPEPLALELEPSETEWGEHALRVR